MSGSVEMRKKKGGKQEEMRRSGWRAGRQWFVVSISIINDDVQEAEWKACGSNGSRPDDVCRRPQQRNIVIKPGPVKALVASHLLDVIELRVLGVGACRYIMVADQNIKLVGGEAVVTVRSEVEDAVSSCQHISLVDCK